MEDDLCLNGCVNRALNVMRFTINTGLKMTPFELHHGRKPKTELTKVMKTGKSLLYNWSETIISANTRPKIPIYVTRNGDGGFTTTSIWPEKKSEEKTLTENSPKKNFS